ncbi:hypothetical protein MBLNU230_g8027t1 [Neophaeotheca triangularis]
MASPTSPLASLSSELDELSPRFDVSADNIEILKTPTEFFETLKTKIAGAKRRIYLSTLYIGKAEHELIATIQDSLERNPDLNVSILTDFLRGTREEPDPSCASLLASLVQRFGSERVEIRMFHTPNLTGLRKKLLPKRINEGWGLQHMKLYGVDNEIILSGANLSNDYFTNRQDRYHLFKSKQITEYFEQVYRTTCDLSYRVLPDDKKPSGFITQWPESNVAPAPLSNPKGYIASATKALAPLSKPTSTPRPQFPTTDTQIYPLLQLTPLLHPDTSTELPALTKILTALSTPAFANSSWTFTAGYFNMTPSFRNLLLRSNPARANIIAASPWANGFYGSKGISGMLPAAYTHKAKDFLHAATSAGLDERITLREWRRGTVGEPGGWTYHAKGLWVTLPGEREPSVSIIGSSNYTKRSYTLDLEANALIVTRNEGLMRRLGQEERALGEFAQPVGKQDFESNERRVGWHVRVAMWIVDAVGGAL